MNGTKTENGSYHFEAGKYGEKRDEKGRLVFDDVLHVWFKSRDHAIGSIENLVNQLRDSSEHGGRISLSLCGELRFKKEN